MNITGTSVPRRRAAALALTGLIAVFALSCALLDRPTPIAVPTAVGASATASPAAETPSTDAGQATATAQPSETAAPATATVAPDTATPSPAATATSSPATATAAAIERISFASGSTYFDLVGKLAANEVRRYALGIAGGQHLELSVTPLEGEALTFSLVGADGTVVYPDGDPFFKGTVPTTQDYVLTITNRGGAVDFGLSLMIPVRITFAPGETAAELETTQTAQTVRAYVIRGLGGQVMTARATATQGKVIMMVVGVDGTVLQGDGPQSPQFSSNLNTTQDYLILVRAEPGADARYTLEVSIPPLGGPTATPEPITATRISFATGATEATVSGQVPANTTVAYGLRALEGQLMEVTLWPASGIAMSIVGADGQILMPQGTGFFRNVLPKSQDYTLRLTAGAEAVTYNVTVMLPVRVTFDGGATSAELTASLPPFTTGHYVIRALGGQTMIVEATTTSGQVILIVYGADGTVLQTDHSGSATFSGVLPSTQDYLIDVRSVGTATAATTLRFTIPPR